MTTTTKADRAKQKAEQDAVLARVSVALARSQRLIDSWLPVAPASTTHAPDDETSLNDLSASATWGGLPDRVGLGGKVENTNGLTANGSSGSSELDKLHKQLLGKKAGKGIARTAAPKSGFMASKPMNGNTSNGSGQPKGATKAQAESESEDEGGRSAAFKSKKHKGNGIPSRVQSTAPVKGSGIAKDKKEHNVDSDESPPRNLGSKRKLSYLDELLAERSRKKKKKKKKATAGDGEQ